jgi:hypothetical protein
MLAVWVNVQTQKRYSPAEFIGVEKRRITGNPDFKEVLTSYVERQNLTMRMGTRRFTRLTNGFSKKIGNRKHAVARHFMHYNFAHSQDIARDASDSGRVIWQCLEPERNCTIGELVSRAP